LRRQAGQHQEAVQTLEKGSAVQDSNDDIIFYLGESYWDLGKKESAVKQYVKLINMKSGHVEKFRSDPAKWRDTQQQINWLAFFIHPKYGLLPFFIGVGAIFLTIVAIGVMLIKRWSDTDED
jgi:tetratricopeptide (TPR) repeat protein